MAKSKIYKQWNIPVIKWRIRLIQHALNDFAVKVQPMEDQGELSCKRWYNLLGSNRFETASGAAWAILNRLGGGDL